MSKAENFTVRMGEDLKQRMKDHPEINWSHIIREHIHSMLDDIERMDQLAATSSLTDEEVDELAAMIDEAAAERAQEDRDTVDPNRDTRHGETDEEAPSEHEIHS